MADEEENLGLKSETMIPWSASLMNFGGQLHEHMRLDQPSEMENKVFVDLASDLIAELWWSYRWSSLECCWGQRSSGKEQTGSGEGPWCGYAGRAWIAVRDNDPVVGVSDECRARGVPSLQRLKVTVAAVMRRR